MNNSVCCIFNLAPHYSAPIYKLIDSEFNCDFYLGDRFYNPLKLMNYTELKGYKKTLKFISLFNAFYWQKGSIYLSVKNYNHYIITGDPYCISTWIILLITRLSGKKTYLWTHGWYGDEDFLKKIFKKIFLGLSYRVLLYGDYARNLMIMEGFNEKKLFCIYNSLDYDNQLKIRKNLKPSNIYTSYFKNGNPTIIYTGRVQRVKMLDLLIHAVYELNKMNQLCNLVIVGNEIDGSSLKNLIIDLGLENTVWLYGACYDESKIGELFYNSRICVSPGNVGLTAVHAFSYGIPVITHDNFPKQMPEFEIIREGITGSFFKENSIPSLVEKIKFWLNEDEVAEKAKSLTLKVIDEKYNPHYQINLLKKLIICISCFLYF